MNGLKKIRVVSAFKKKQIEARWLQTSLANLKQHQTFEILL